MITNINNFVCRVARHLNIIDSIRYITLENNKGKLSGVALDDYTKGIIRSPLYIISIYLDLVSQRVCMQINKSFESENKKVDISNSKIFGIR